MSNSFRGQTQYTQSPMGYGGGGYGDPMSVDYGGYGAPMGRPRGGSMGQPSGGSMGGGYGQSYASPFDSPFGNPLASQFGGYGTTFGGEAMGGGGYGFLGQQRQRLQQPMTPQYEPTVNDLFSQYFSQQYYGGQAFNPFAATSLFGGGYGGGYGGGGGGRGAGNRMRDRRKMFEDLFAPEKTDFSQPEPMPARQPQVQPQVKPQVQPQVQPQEQPQAQTGTGGGGSRTFTGPNALIDSWNAAQEARRTYVAPTPPGGDIQYAGGTPGFYDKGGAGYTPAVMPSAPERPFMPTISDPDYQGVAEPAVMPKVREPQPPIEFQVQPSLALAPAPAASPFLQPGRSAIRRSFGNR